MSAEEFLRRVARTGMVSQPLMDELHRRVAETTRQVRPEMLAKLLVDRGELTPAQARRLVAQLQEPPPPPKRSPGLAIEPTSDEPEVGREQEYEELKLVDDDEELQLASEPEDLIGSADSGEGEDELELVDEEDAPEGILIDKVPAAERDDTFASADPAATSGPPPPPPTDSPVASSPEPRDIFDEPLAADEQIAASTRLKRRPGLRAFWDELFGPRRPRKNRWDSPLILLGGAALILLVAAALGFWALFRGESSDELWRLAEEAYRSRSYDQAIERFDEFNERYPGHDKASSARVLAILAQLRQSTEGAQDWRRALNVARQSLPTVEQEPAFAEARIELSKLLPDITAGLVEQARAAGETDEQARLIALADASLELVNKSAYLPTSVRASQELRIEEIENNIEIVKRDIQRDRDLQAALSRITGATSSGDITDAYRIRDELLRTYPTLSENAALAAKLLDVAEKERDAVSVTSAEGQPLTDDHPRGAGSRVVLSDHRGDSATGLQGQVLGVLVRGAVYGIDAVDGRVLWRRYVGFETGIAPQRISGQADGDFLLVDARRGELLRVRATTGSLVWRLPCPSPIAEPRIVGDRVLVSLGRAEDSALLSVDLRTGNPLKRVTLPVGCHQSPAVSSSRGEVFQLGSHSSLYVLDVDTLQCKAVIPLGHVRRGVHVAPVTVGELLLVCENTGSNASLVHVFAPGGEGGWSPVRDPLRLRGHVMSPPAVDQRRAVVTTDRGELSILEAVEDGSSREVARRPGGDEYRGETFVLLDGSDLWLAGEELQQFELQATRGELVLKWVRYNEDVFNGPLQRQAGHLVHVRRRGQMAGATVALSSTSGGAGGQSVWETDLGAPSRLLTDADGRVVVDGQRGALAMTTSGALFRVDGEALKTGIAARRADRIDPRLLPEPLVHQLFLSDRDVVFTTAPPIRRLVHVDPAAGGIDFVPLALDSDAVSTELVPLGDGLLAACAAGPVHLVDPRTGKSRLSPLLPRVRPNAQFDWLRPAVWEPAGQFVIAEKGGRLYRVAVNFGQGTLELRTENDLDVVFTAGLARAGNFVYGTVAGQGGGAAVIAIDSTNLTIVLRTPLEAAVQWGPRSVAARVFVSDRRGTVYCFGDEGRLAWKSDQPLGPIAGSPALIKDQFVFASMNGDLWVVDDQGNIVARENLAEPLGGGPARLGNGLLLTGWDGTLYRVDVPR